MNIRLVETIDVEQITEIYNFYVRDTHHTFETEPVGSAKMRNRIEEITADYPFFVAEENGKISGYAYAAQYKSRCAYKNSAEISVYVANDVRQKGIGARLYKKLFERLFETDVHAVIAGIALPNEASIRLHERFGFEKVAHFRQIGWKFNRWIDVGYWELINEK